MKIVIDIPKHIYEHAKEKSEDSNDEWDAMRAIANGTLLPEHHGRLIDADAYINEYSVYGWLGDTEIDDFNEITPTIIERSDADDKSRD